VWGTILASMGHCVYPACFAQENCSEACLLDEVEKPISRFSRVAISTFSGVGLIVDPLFERQSKIQGEKGATRNSTGSQSLQVLGAGDTPTKPLDTRRGRHVGIGEKHHDLL
jgi:hypothetical protein